MVLYQDPRILVVSKPARMPTHPGQGDRTESMLQWLRRRDFGPLHPAHRLDRATSGLLVWARDPEAAAHLALQFRTGRVDKRYLALTRGHPPEFGVLDHPVPDGRSGRRIPARTAFARHGVEGRYALVELSPRTGRRHQLRRHLKHMSCPIIGDVEYGKGSHNRLFRREHGLERMALHAFAVRLAHPDDGRTLVFTIPAPRDLAGPLQDFSARLWACAPPAARDRSTKGF